MQDVGIIKQGDKQCLGAEKMREREREKERRAREYERGREGEIEAYSWGFAFPTGLDYLQESGSALDLKSLNVFECCVIFCRGTCYAIRPCAPLTFRRGVDALALARGVGKRTYKNPLSFKPAGPRDSNKRSHGKPLWLAVQTR